MSGILLPSAPLTKFLSEKLKNNEDMEFLKNYESVHLVSPVYQNPLSRLDAVHIRCEIVKTQTLVKTKSQSSKSIGPSL